MLKMWKIFCIAWIVGIALMGQSLTFLTDYAYIIVALACAIQLLLLCFKTSLWRHTITALCLACTGVTIGYVYGDHALQQRLLYRELTARPVDAVVYIKHLDQPSARRIQQKAQVLGSSLHDVYWQLLLTTPQNKSEKSIKLQQEQQFNDPNDVSNPQQNQQDTQTNKSFQLGQYYRIHGNIRPAHSYATEGTFDSERWFLHENLMASVQVKWLEPLSPQQVQDLGFAYHVQQQQQWQAKALLGIEKLRLKLRQDIQNLPLQQRGLILALLTGDESQLNRSTEEQFQRLGISHLLAISGPHVLILAMMLTWLINKLIILYVPKWYRRVPRPYFLCIPFLATVLFYTAFVGFEPPALRTLLMTTVGVVLLLLHRKLTALSVLLLAASILLLLMPLSVFGAAFWLSFGASFILLRIYQSLQEQQHTPIAKNDWAYHQQKIKRATWLLWQSQWKIFIALFPLTMIFFQKVSWLAPFVNLVAIPILGACIVPLNMLAAVVHFIYADLAALLWQIVEIFINILLALLNFFDRAFDASLTAFAFTSLMLVLLCIIIALLLLPKGVLPKSWVIAVIAIIAVSLYQDHRTEIHILDIGQGQAIYLKDAQYHALIDTGGYYDEERFSIGQNVVVPFLLRQGVKQLDDVILSHLDNDHIGALPYIAKDIDIQNIRTNESLKQQIEFQQDDDYQTLLTLPEQLCLAGQHWQLSPNFDVQVLSPNTHDAQLIRQNRNEYSCVLYLTVKNVHGDYRHFLFMGDAGWQTEQEIMQRYPHLPVDVLVVGHHGSRHSSLPEFVAHYRPKLAIASAGFNNRYGHPHQDVVDIFKNLNIPFISTIEQGTIRFAQHKQTAQWTWSAYRQQLPWLQREQTQKHNANE